ncbi:MAG: hypothetical protein ACOZIN_21930, partial [Myxococcota bacterium]
FTEAAVYQAADPSKRRSPKGKKPELPNAIIKISKTDGAVSRLADLVAYPSDLFVDSAHLYWVEAETIWRSGKTPVVPTELAMGEHPTRVSADDGHLYWIDGVRGWGDLRQRPKSGGASTLIAPNVVAFVIDERTIYWVVHQGFVTQRAK